MLLLPKKIWQLQLFHFVLTCLWKTEITTRVSMKLDCLHTQRPFSEGRGGGMRRYSSSCHRGGHGPSYIRHRQHRQHPLFPLFAIFIRGMAILSPDADLQQEETCQILFHWGEKDQAALSGPNPARSGSGSDLWLDVGSCQCGAMQSYASQRPSNEAGDIITCWLVPWH